MLATTVRRRMLWAFCVTALVYSLIVVTAPRGQQEAEAFDVQLPPNLIGSVWVGLTNTATATWTPDPGSSPGLKIITENRHLRAFLATGPGYGTEKAYHQNSNLRGGDSTFIIEPGWSGETDFQLLSGTALPVGFRFPGRGGKPGRSDQNPVNLSGGHDSGTATARVCYDGVFIGGFGDTCTFARRALSGDTVDGTGPGNVNCPMNWGLTTESSSTTPSPSGGNYLEWGAGAGPSTPHIVMITNDSGPVNRTWGPLPGNIPAGSGGYAHPQGQLWDTVRQRWAYARWTAAACAGLSIGGLGGNRAFMLFVSIWVYKDDPYPGAYTMIVSRPYDSRVGGAYDAQNSANYKACGNLDPFGSPPRPNPCNSIASLSLGSDMFGSSRRIATTQKVCGRYFVTAMNSNNVTSPGPATAVGSGSIDSSGYPSCPAGLRGVIAASTGRPLQGAQVYAFDSVTGQLVNSVGGTGAAQNGCTGGFLPASTGGPAPGPTTSTSYGCDTVPGNTGFYPHVGPGGQDGRWYIRANTGGPGYKVLASAPPGSGQVSKWIGGPAPTGDWNTAPAFTAVAGAAPAVAGEGGGVTTTLSAAARTVTGSVTRNGTWTTGVDDGRVGVWSTAGVFEATPTALTGSGTYNLGLGTANSKLRFELFDGAGNPNLIGWYAGSGGAPAPNFTAGTTVSTSGALGNTPFTSGSTVSGAVQAAASGSEVSVYRNSDGQLIYVTLADATGAWTTRVPAAASAYKVYVRAPAAATLQNKWFNLQDTWGAANLVSAPSSGNNMTLPSGSAIQGYVKNHAGAADVAGAPVYAYNSTTGAFVGWGSTGSNGRYRIELPAGSYKVWTAGSPTLEDQWFDGSQGWNDSTAVAAPGTANFSLRAAGNISGTSSTSGTPTANYYISAFANNEPYANTLSGAGGAYSLKVPTTAASGNQYKVRFIPPSGSSSSTRWYLNQLSIATANDVASPSTGINQDTPA